MKNAAAILSRQEMVLLSRITDLGRKIDFLAGRALLKRVCADKLGRRSREIRLQIYTNGALKLPDCPDYGLVISHSRKMVIAVMDIKAVGADIEYMDSARPMAKIMRRLGAEPASPADSPELLEEFYTFWTRREAAFKLRSNQRASGNMPRTERAVNYQTQFLEGPRGRYCLTIASYKPVKGVEMVKKNINSVI